MVIYFSGTGNTSYVARTISDYFKEECRFLPSLRKETIVFTGEVLIFCFPIYSWGVPPMVLDFISALPDSFIESISTKDIPVIMVATAGDEVARAPEIFMKAWRKHDISVSAIWDVIMPNNYVLLPGFDVDSTAVEENKLELSEKRLSYICYKIKNKDWETDVTRGSMAGFKSRIIYPLFIKWGINPKKWNVSKECIGCGRCANVCPVENIRIVQGRPKWNSNCVSCTACYHICPADAINYGSITRHKGHYFCKKKPVKLK